MLERNKLYKRRDNNDTAIEVVDIRYWDKHRVKVEVAWWNVVAKPFSLGFSETIEIQTKDLVRWKPIGWDGCEK